MNSMQAAFRDAPDLYVTLVEKGRRLARKRSLDPVDDAFALYLAQAWKAAGAHYHECRAKLEDPEDGISIVAGNVVDELSDDEVHELTEANPSLAALQGGEIGAMNTEVTALYELTCELIGELINGWVERQPDNDEEI